ncbi:MAG: hypothetical protein JXB48_05625 [Candidatus Latescibacteria bacterium]|nr:hypothetical protein [Candidatus Latescibacterota bacterium]
MLNLKRIIFTGFFIVVPTVGFFSCSPQSSAPDYLKVIQDYADTMIEHGRDTYGSEHTPLFAVSLDRKTLRIHDGEALDRILAIERADWGIRSHDRMVQGANPMQDQNLYQVLYALSELTGDQRYANEADKALKWFFEHCQSPTTGLFAWGEHIGWDFNTETIIEKNAGTTHEFARPWMLWDISFRLAPKSCNDFALGLWNHQIADKEQGLYSRHARYDEHGPGIGSEYPRHGGFYIATWAEAYAHTKNPEFLKAIECLVNSYENRRNEKTGGIMAETQSPDLMWPHSNLSLAVDLWNSAEKVPIELAEKMRACASKTDDVYLKIAHDLSSGGEGFMIHAVTSTLEPGWLRLGKPDDTQPHFSDIWATSYGNATDAQIAMLCYLRYRQVPLDGYRTLILDTADRYLTSDPDTTIALYPGALADAIALLLTTYDMTGEKCFLDRADTFGRMAVNIFFDSSPLPRASSKHDHYEAITRGDTLVMDLLLLWLAMDGDRKKPGDGPIPDYGPTPWQDTWLVYNER